MNPKNLLPLVKKTVALTAATACVAATFSVGNIAEAKVSKKAKNKSYSSSSVIRVNPKNLRLRLLNGDTSVMIGLNQVYMAKVQLAGSRASLLPSLNLTGALAGGPSFLLTSVNVLLPFLLPSNWFNLDASQANLAATGYGFYALELNEMASAYAVYETIVNDMDTRDAYEKVYNNYASIEDAVHARYSVGQAVDSDLKTAQSNMENAKGLIRKADELIAQEKAAMRMMLGVTDLNAVLEFDRIHMPKLAAEGSSAQRILDSTYFKSPERDQMISLIAAAKAQKLSTAFSFLNNASIGFQSSGNSGGGIKSFNNPVGEGSVGLSLALFPAINLGELNVQQLQIRSKQVLLQEGNLIEASLYSVRNAQAQVDHYTLALQAADQAYDDKFSQYKTGNGDLNNVDLANLQVQTAALNLVQAQLDLDNQRVTLTRALIAGQFSNIRSCRLADGSGPNLVTGFFSNIAGIFSLQANTVSVDQLCKNN